MDNDNTYSQWYEPGLGCLVCAIFGSGMVVGSMITLVLLW